MMLPQGTAAYETSFARHLDGDRCVTHPSWDIAAMLLSSLLETQGAT